VNADIILRRKCILLGSFIGNRAGAAYYRRIQKRACILEGDKESARTQKDEHFVAQALNFFAPINEPTSYFKEFQRSIPKSDSPRLFPPRVS